VATTGVSGCSGGTTGPVVYFKPLSTLAFALASSFSVATTGVSGTSAGTTGPCFF
tara:strand:- start:799 stop:963 length:165 start_codon:yes stop_codon:yes gene_type:complete